MPGSFTGMERDHAGPVERPLQHHLLWLSQPRMGPPALVEDEPAVEAPIPAPGPAVGTTFLPMDTALSLQALTAALLQPVKCPDPARPAAPTPVVEDALTQLADQLQARFQSGPDLSGSLDLLAPMDETGTPSAPSAAAPAAGPAAPSTASPAGIRAAAGLLAAPAKPTLVPARPIPAPAVARQGDIFFSHIFTEPDPLDQPDPPDLLLAQHDVLERPDIPDVRALPALQAAVPPAAPSPPRAPLSLTQPPPLMEVLPELPLLPPLSEVPALPVLSAISPDESRSGSGIRAEASELPLSETMGAGALLGGAGLILGGIFLACRLPLQWLSLADASAWGKQLIEAGLILQAGAASFLLILGAATVMQRRWAGPLIIAAGWLAIFTASLMLGITGYFLGAESEINLSSWDTGCLFAGLLIPLAYLLYFEKAAATRSREEPALPSVPVLMVLLCGLILALAAAAMFRHPLAVPLPGNPLLTGPAAGTFLGGLLVGGLLTAFIAARHKSLAWWILMLSALAFSLTFGYAGISGGSEWLVFLNALGRPATAAPPSSFLPLCCGLAPIVLLIALAMSRRAFASPPPP